MSFNRMRNIMIAVYQRTLYPILKKDNYKTIKRNAKFKGIHAGERCFVIGNGPSVAKMDLSCLKDEYVFTVNQAARNKQFSEIKSNYHFWVDQNFFKGDDDDPGTAELIKTMFAVNTPGNKPECFFPINQKGFIKKHGLDSTISANYISMQYEIVDDNFPVDMTKSLPCPMTVVHACIFAAIYMGFSEIYLLGCDNTGLVANINSFIESENDGIYSYEISENEKKRMANLFQYESLEQYVYSFYKNLVNYRYISRYCGKHGIKIANCTPTTTIDSIERIPFEKVMNHEC